MIFLNILKSRRAQATVEVTLLLPIFVILGFFVFKVYGLLVVVQKTEIAAYYAGRRWQLESHKSLDHVPWDNNVLRKDIEDKVRDILDFNNPALKKARSLRSVSFNVERGELWNTLTLTVRMYPPRIPFICKYDKLKVCDKPYGQDCLKGYNFLCEGGGTISVTKNVVNRDRPNAWLLPGSQ
ncbi:MAG: pilus assembly protein [Elusimicrobiota bacterium]|nr:pilus assembly protein [Elusimicrobiota bacterium]